MNSTANILRTLVVRAKEAEATTGKVLFGSVLLTEALERAEALEKRDLIRQ